MFFFEKLNIYQESIALVKIIYLLSDRFPKNEEFGITRQFRRAVVSIPLNIAEGTSRSKKDFNHFLDMARGSCFECVALLKLISLLQYID